MSKLLNTLKTKREYIQVFEKYPEFYDVAKILLDAAKSGKYKDENWLQSDGQTMSRKNNCSSIFRHDGLVLGGEILDKESKTHHFLHIAGRALMGYVRDMRGITHVDDPLYPELHKLQTQQLDDSNCLTIEENNKKHEDNSYFFNNREQQV